MRALRYPILSQYFFYRLMCSLSLFISLFQLLPDFPVLAQFFFYKKSRIIIDLRPPLLTFIKILNPIITFYQHLSSCSSSCKTFFCLWMSVAVPSRHSKNTYFLRTLHVKFSRQSFRHSCECTHAFTALDQRFKFYPHWHLCLKCSLDLEEMERRSVDQRC